MDTNTIAIITLLGSFTIMLILRVQIAFSLLLSSILCAMTLDMPLQVLGLKTVTGLTSNSLMAIPFFILAGEIMSEGGISRRLIDFSKALVGRFRGGLALVNVLTSMFFGGISGSAVADASSIGSVLIPLMKRDGYDSDYSVAVTISAATQGIIIPPSHNMIIYSMAAGGLSVGALFMAGLIPGIMLGFSLMILSYLIAVKRNYPKGEKVPFNDLSKAFISSALGLFTAVIIMVGVLFGICTPTESAAVAAVYAFIITFFVYKEIPLSHLNVILTNTLRTLGIVMAIIATSTCFGYLIATLEIPKLVASGMVAITDNPIILLLLINIILLLLGMIMDMAPLILIATPILLPVAMHAGMDKIQFGIVMMLNLGVGLLTPPVGTTLFVGASIGKITMEETVSALKPFYIVMVIVLLALTYIPAISLFLPRMFGLLD